eukprot:388247-Alexandrium_andersonii.AAC.1
MGADSLSSGGWVVGVCWRSRSACVGRTASVCWRVRPSGCRTRGREPAGARAGVTPSTARAASK